MTLACILGCSGPVLTPEERDFFAEVRPWGFILFRRNVESPEQVRDLTAALREAVGRPDAPILIDQEGGRVQRLRPPHWPSYPSGRAYLRAANGDLSRARELVRTGARLIAADLKRLGIDVDCVPVVDVPQPGAHEIIGDRAYGETVEAVASLGRAAAEGLLAGGVLPVVKHVPGHGRANADSHVDLPVVDTPLDVLDAVDFRPFRVCSDLPMAMTAHVVYTAVDPKRPATQSRKAVRLIRETIGFKGLLMTDDLSMEALKGDLSERAAASIKAGCDVVLHCNGRMDEMAQVVAGTPKLKGEAKRRAAAALARLPAEVEPLDEAETRERFFALFDDQAPAPKGPAAGEA